MRTKGKHNLKTKAAIEQRYQEIFILSGHKIEFEIGSFVYLKTDDEQELRIVTVINLRPHRCVTYSLALGTSESWHYGIEISKERNILKY